MEKLTSGTSRTYPIADAAQRSLQNGLHQQISAAGDQHLASPPVVLIVLGSLKDLDAQSVLLILHLHIIQLSKLFHRYIWRMVQRTFGTGQKKRLCLFQFLE